MDDRQEIKSLKKALRALTVMNKKGDATVTDIAVGIGVPRTTAYRLLETLAAEGYIAKQPNSGYYRLTSAVLQLASGFQSENLFLEIAQPLLSDLGRRIGWSVSLATPRANEMVTRITTNHDTALALDRFMIGTVVPMLHATTGFCYLAYCNDSEREILVGMARASGDPLLARVRTRGFCNLEFNAYREGNVGVPLLIDGRPLGGIVMRYIKSAMTGEKLFKEYIPLLKEVSEQISEQFLSRCASTDIRVPNFGLRAEIPVAGTTQQYLI
jgi:IclR family mhp operon transcriptional activator